MRCFSTNGAVAAGVVTAAALVGVLFGAAAHADPLYLMTRLPTLGRNITPQAISDGGWVTGVVRIDGSVQNDRAFRYDPSTGLISDLGAFAANSYSGGYDVSAAGLVVGEAADWTGTTLGLQRAATLTYNQNLPIVGRGLNDAGWIVGAKLTGDDRQAAVLAPGAATPTLIPELAPGTRYDYAHAINSHHTVVGARQDANYKNVAFVHHADTGATLNLQHLPGFTDRAEAFDVNDAGRAVGYSKTDYPYTDLKEQAVMWDTHTVTSPTATSLGYFADPAHGLRWGSQALAINNHGAIVGKAHVITGGSAQTGWSIGYHAFLHRDGQMVDLNTLVDLPAGYVLEVASDINDLDQIVGYGHDAQWQRFAFVLDLNPDVIPEPGVLALLAAGIGVAAPWRRARPSHDGTPRSRS